MVHQKKKILCVDDDPATLMLLEGLLSKSYQVAMARDGLKAMEFFKAEKFDLVLTDLQMPNLDGFELMKSLRVFKPGTPIIVLTKYSDSKSIRRSWKLGAFDLVEKPVDREQLFQAIEVAFNHQTDWHKNHSLADSLLASKSAFRDKAILKTDVWTQFLSNISQTAELSLKEAITQFSIKSESVLRNFDPENEYNKFSHQLRELHLVCREVGAEALEEICEEIIESLQSGEVITRPDLNVIRAASQVVFKEMLVLEKDKKKAEDQPLLSKTNIK